jgi:hypothetical protein
MNWQTKVGLIAHHELLNKPPQVELSRLMWLCIAKVNGRHINSKKAKKLTTAKI